MIFLLLLTGWVMAAVTTTSPMEGTQRALVVGVASYSDPAIHDLRFTTHDAEDVGAMLEASGFEVTILADEVTAEQIRKVLSDLTHELTEQDTILVYFSGHGTLEIQDGTSHLYLLASDSALERPAQTGLSMAELHGFITRMRAVRRVLVVDACHSGKGRSALSERTRQARKRLKGAAPEAHTEAPTPYEVRLYAAYFHQAAHEDEELENGVYTHYLVQAADPDLSDLDGDGCVELLEAHRYATERVTEHSRGQTPWAEITKVGEAAIHLSGSGCGRPTRGLLHAGDYDTFRLDGLTERGLAGASPGWHRVQVGEEGSEVVDTRLWIREGQRIGVDSLIDARSARVLWGIGGSLGPGDPYLTDATAHLAVTWLPADRKRGRVALGLEAALGLGAVEGLERFPTGQATAHAGWLWGHHVLWGPSFHAGLAWRVPPTDPQSGVLFGLGA